MPYFVGQGDRSEVSTLSRYYGKGIDAMSLPADRSPYHQRKAFLADPERSRHPRLAEMVLAETYRSTISRTTLPDYLAGHYGYMDMQISDKVKRAIEQFEPGRHYFFPLNILKRNLEPWPEQYWMFKAGPSAIAQSMIVEQSSSLEWKPIGLEHYAFSRRMNCQSRFGFLAAVGNHSAVEARGFVVDRAVFEGRHVVLEDVYRNDRVFFFSDALVAVLKAVKAKGFKFVKVKAEERRIPAYGASNGTGAVA